MQAFAIKPAGFAQIRKKAAVHLSPWVRGVSALLERVRTAPRKALRAQTVDRFWSGGSPPGEHVAADAQLASSALILPSVPSSLTNERRRVAAQIHHSLAQHMATVLMQLQLCERYVAADPDRGLEFLRSAMRSAQVAMDATRAIIYELQYPPSRHPRIAALLHITAGRLGSPTTAICVDVEDVGALSPAVESGLCVIACEALTNAVKHAGAEHITVRLRRSQETLVLEVGDDGIGFDPDAARARNGGGFGLKLMREQAERLGGTFQVNRRSPRGVLARVVVQSALRPSAPRPDPDMARPDRPSGT